jgi:hypothetical protein
MRYAPIHHIPRSRLTAIIAVFAIVVSIALSEQPAQGRVDPVTGTRAASVKIADTTTMREASQSADTTAKVTGGGTVLATPTYPTTVASFGLNARRPQGYIGGGAALGRINYNRHRNSVGRHVNITVSQMQAFDGNGQTGGSASLIGDCTPPNECSPGTSFVLVYVEDNSDSGAGSDVFRIFDCTGFPVLPGPGFNGSTPPPGCAAGEGGLLRTGNIQVRGDPAVVGEQISTAAAAGIFPTTPTFNGVDLAGGIYSLGVRTGTDSTYGDLHAEFTGISPLGLYQIISVDGWITSGSIVGGTMTFSGTATLDMGDGPPPVGGLSLSGTLSATGITLTVNGSSLPALPKTDGYTTME